MSRKEKLAAVKIDEKDVALIAQEMEISDRHAEQTLREHDGNLKAALKALLAQ